MSFVRRWLPLTAPIVGAAVLGAWLLAPRASAGRMRTYYVAADEVQWDYAPSGMDEMMGHPLDTTEFAIGNGPPRAARVFRKAVYREYLDSSFTTPKPRAPEWEHLGIVGPVLRAEVGDTFRVVFRNNGRYPFSMHPHGVQYTKGAEGALYSDGTSGVDKLDDAVAPGATHTYIWPVPERAGPGPDDPSTIMWAYHSHTHEWRDVNAGLIGPIIVGRRGSLAADGRPKGVDREFVTLFGVFAEMESRYTPDNLLTYTGDTLPRTKAGPVSFSGVGMQTINGYMFGNLPTPTMRMQRGEHVRWYVFSATMADDFHSPHWHGATVLIDRKRTDVASLAVPLLMLTADMVPDVAGTWMLHCHVAEHMASGMAARFVVEDGPLARR
jgi:manganese oxidase